MEKFKASELKIVRPLKLVDSKSWKALVFPYNMLAKAGLIANSELESFLYYDSFFSSKDITVKKKIQSMFQGMVPKGLYKSALHKRKETFHLLTENITIAQRQGGIDYIDVFTGEKLLSYNQNATYRDFHDVREANDKLSINSKYISSLVLLIYDQEINNFPYCEKDVSFEAKHSLLKQIEESELTIEQLEALKNLVIETEHNKEITFEHAHTDPYADTVFYHTVSSYGLNGKKVSPTVENKVKERKLIIP